MTCDTIVRGGVIVGSGCSERADLLVKDGKVVGRAVDTSGVEAKTIIDAAGKYILPGLVDPHVHAGHGDPNRANFGTASRAAAAGGITTFMEQPLSYPPTVTPQAVKDKIADAAAQCVVDYGVWGGLVPGHLEDMKACFDLGAQAFKSFMCKCSNYPTTPDGIILKGLKILAEFGGLHAVHAESDDYRAPILAEFAALDKNDIEAFLIAHNPVIETGAIARYIFVASQVPGSKTHCVHVSTPEGHRMLKKAKAEGIDISGETCPQYLGLTEDDLYRIGGVCKCDPPVRSKELVEELWSLVLAGDVDMIASDHAPHPFNQKVVPMDKFSTANEGVTANQTMLPVILSEGVHRRGMKLEQVVRLMCENTARRYGMFPRKGNLGIGADADFIVLDLDREWVCKAENMHYKNKHTPFDGRTFKGYVEKTYVRGTLVCDNNAIRVDSGFGEYIPMQMQK